MNDDDLNKISVLIDKKLEKTEERIIGEFNKFVEFTLLPQLDEKADKSDLKNLATKDDLLDLASKSDIDRVERKLDKLAEMGIDQETRINRLEKSSVVSPN